MDIKDQRLEIRIPQQQLDELDKIRESSGSPFTNTRSDIVRMFISQGLERLHQKEERSPDSFQLADRLSLFFHMELAYPTPIKGRNYNHLLPQTPAHASEVIRKIYLNRYFWFFELDADSLELISPHFKTATILSLLNQKPNVKTVQNLKNLVDIIKMFEDIVRCSANDPSNEKLSSLIIKNASLKNMPLKFSGFPKNSMQLNEIAGLVLWAEAASPDRFIMPHRECSDYSLNTYLNMLDIYQTITQHNTELTDELLLTMINQYHS
ncbi:ribbon-helix-helix domain-containing protein [Pseudomonas graminis]|uniref:ribbon-helix-helix domain-containing protein n=1 Tax=Pseudomonas graminis TaxID=158627 RepID=UPI0023493541|nr:ribbon-helix-helix domain-containing protein [Pseudomonas graminis]MDC6379887.1 ribbon-helix-helix domain-containing protein [Pseudomonas graminis]